MAEEIMDRLEQIGSCETLIGAFAEQLPTAEQIEKVKITVDGDTARYAIPNDTAEFTYVDGSWKVADDVEGTN